MFRLIQYMHIIIQLRYTYRKYFSWHEWEYTFYYLVFIVYKESYVGK